MAGDVDRGRVRSGAGRTGIVDSHNGAVAVTNDSSWKERRFSSPLAVYFGHVIISDSVARLVASSNRKRSSAFSSADVRKEKPFERRRRRASSPSRGFSK